MELQSEIISPKKKSRLAVISIIILIFLFIISLIFFPYSIGQDGRDSGGSQGQDWQKMLDPTFKINF